MPRPLREFQIVLKLKLRFPTQFLPNLARQSDWKNVFEDGEHGIEWYPEHGFSAMMAFGVVGFTLVVCTREPEILLTISIMLVEKLGPPYNLAARYGRHLT